MKAKYLIPVLGLLGLIGLGVLGVSYAKAEDSITYLPIVQRLSEKFNLSQDEVKSVFDEEHQARIEEMEKVREERLNQAVNDGVITEDQKKALLNKWEEMHQEREQHKVEMQSWLEEQGIDPTKLAPYGGFGGRGFGHGHMMMGR